MLSLTLLLGTLSALSSVTSLPTPSDAVTVPEALQNHGDVYPVGSIDFFDRSTCSNQEMIPTGPIFLKDDSCKKFTPPSSYTYLGWSEAFTKIPYTQTTTAPTRLSVFARHLRLCRVSPPAPMYQRSSS